MGQTPIEFTPSFFLIFKIYFNWRLITLQYCGGFCHTFTEISHWVYMCSPSWTHLPPLSPSHSSGSSQCTSPEHPVSCIEPGLEICFTYDTIHVSMLFSQIIPPSPSPTESKRLFYTSVSLLLSRNSIYCFRLLRTFYQMLHKDDMSTVVMIWFWIITFGLCLEDSI